MNPGTRPALNKSPPSLRSASVPEGIRAPHARSAPAQGATGGPLSSARRRCRRRPALPRVARAPVRAACPPAVLVFGVVCAPTSCRQPARQDRQSPCQLSAAERATLRPPSTPRAVNKRPSAGRGRPAARGKRCSGGTESPRPHHRVSSGWTRRCEQD